MKRFIVTILLLSTIFLQNCAPKKSIALDVEKPSIIFTFEGIRPKFFKALEADIRKSFEKEGVAVGFAYNLKIPPADNHDYLDMPKYTYDKTFDVTWNINFTKIENKPYNPKEQERNSIYRFILSLYKTKTNESIDTSRESLAIIYRYDNRSQDLAKKLLKKYKKLFIKK